MNTPTATTAIRQQPKKPRRSPFLRAIGVDILNDLYARLKRWDAADEPKKRISKRSFYVALQRCGMHIIPCAVSIVCVALNFRGYFIGTELAGLAGRTSQSMAGLQIAAKAQELLIVASLATVLLHRLRHDLVNGRGVPFGLVGATSSFTQLSFFWSSSFLWSISKTTGPSKTLLALVLVSGFIASTAGPAVAVLIIPRERTWAAGGTSYWVNGTFDDLWPGEVKLDHYMPEHDSRDFKAKCTASNAYTNSLCPSGGYMALLQRISNSYGLAARSGNRETTSIPARIMASGSGTLVTSAPLRGQMKLYTLVSAQRNFISVETSAMAVHGPSAYIVNHLGAAWLEAANAAPRTGLAQLTRYRYYKEMQSIVNTSNPVVRVVCSPPAPLSRGQKEIHFPWVPDFDPATKLVEEWKWDNSAVRELHKLTVEDRGLQDREFSAVTKVFRKDLSGVSWTNATTGIIVEYPWTTNDERNVTGCVLDARWADGIVFYEFDSAPQPAVIVPPLNGDHSRYLGGDLFRLTPKSVRKRIDISKEVFDVVNFVLPPDLHGAVFGMPTTRRPPNVTSIEALLLRLRWGNDWSEGGGYVTDVEHTIAVVFADALARANVYRMPPENPFPTRIENWKPEILSNGEAYDPPPGPPDLYTTFKMEQIITGFAYKGSSVTDKLALIVVFMHLAIATGHTLFLLITGRSSGAWDSLTELLSLALRSSPSSVALKNTSVGIYKPRTFRKTTRIRVSKKDLRRVELVFDEDSEDDHGRVPDLALKYG
ncbi:hypothetical protein IQ07DRAFT_86575 [Pyrenochaeta sp. DS3sAY3a]|nr:hypothetical protein IQ07DRAFT_86575 [Pyrenochaeta sp. DS3sAY3a]